MSASCCHVGDRGDLETGGEKESERGETGRGRERETDRQTGEDRRDGRGDYDSPKHISFIITNSLYEHSYYLLQTDSRLTPD